MIQRIQSIYLFLAAVLSAFTLWCPLARFSSNVAKGGYYLLYSLKLSAYGTEPLAGNATTPWGIAAFSAISALLPLITIFLYKNRKKQMAWCKLSLASIVLFYVSYAAYSYSYSQELANTQFAVSWIAVFPIIAFVAIVLAMKGIKKDEDLIRAADRIR